MRRHRRHEPEQAEINVTPMLDIVFIMLIFFIVTTSFVKEVAIDASRSVTQPEQQRTLSEVIAVRITADGRILIDERAVDLRAVRANIEGRLASQPQASVVVIASRAADAGLVVRVIDQARVAGADSVALTGETG